MARKTAVAVMLLMGLVSAKFRGHGHRLQRAQMQQDPEPTAQEDLWSLSNWIMEHGSNIWPPNGGEHPLCPPRRLHHTHSAMCDYPPCNEDLDCASAELPEAETEASGDGDHGGGSYACCYNGCVSTCTKKMEPPIAFDWLEEFRASEDRRDELSSVRDGAPEAQLQLHAHAFPEVIVLPGGCVLTSSQYEELESFRENAHVNKCFCDKGGVSCEVSQVNLSGG